MSLVKIAAILFTTAAVTRIVEDRSYFNAGWKNSGAGALAGAAAGAGVYALLR